MKGSTKQTADVLSALIAERKKYEQWIAALEGKKGSTPAKVYDRVHGDYVARLQGVMEELGARSGELQSQHALLKSRHDDLVAQESALRDERAEADLRNDVGEYTPEQWKDLVKTSDDAIAKLSTERARIDAELESLDRVLAATGPSPALASAPSTAPTATPPSASTAASTAAQPAPAPAVAASKAPVSPASDPPTAAATSSSGATPRRSFDDLAFLQSVAGPPMETADPRSASPKPEERPPERSAVSPAPAAKPASQTPKASMQSVGSPETARRSPAADSMSPASPARQTPAASGTPAGSSPAQKASPQPSASASAASPEPRVPAKQDTTLQRQPTPPLRSSRPVSASDIDVAGIENLNESTPGKNETPNFLKNVPTEQEKTLKCGECGSLNYATEWYCERCGAELSAL